MTRKELELLIGKYNSAESDIIDMNARFGICIYNSEDENFYNKYNYVIFKLFEHIFGDEGRELIEDYIFGSIDIEFNELCEKLNIYE